jgi:hypothetical protein
MPIVARIVTVKSIRLISIFLSCFNQFAAPCRSSGRAAPSTFVVVVERKRPGLLARMLASVQ